MDTRQFIDLYKNYLSEMAKFANEKLEKDPYSQFWSGLKTAYEGALSTLKIFDNTYIKKG